MSELAEADRVATASTPPGEDQGLAMFEDLHVELGRIAGMALPDFTIEGILKRFPEWTYGTENTSAGNLRFLHRTIMDRSVLVELPEPETQSGQVIRDARGIKIRSRSITGGDLQCVIDIENQLLPLEADEITIERKPKLDPEARRFQEAKHEFLQEGDLFTQRESVMFSHMTHCDNLKDLGSAVGVSASSASRVTQGARERLGLETNIDLMLHAIAQGVADIDHIPEGLTSGLNNTDLELLADYYGPDPELREETRQAAPQRGDSRWSRMYDKLESVLTPEQAETLGVNRHWAVLYALKDGAIQLPELSNERLG